MTEIVMTNICMITNPKTGELLVQRRTYGDWQGIAFPGGHIENNESITDSVIREVAEETGLVVKNPHFAGIKNWYSKDDDLRYLIFIFTATEYSGSLTPHGSEGEVFWVKPDLIASLGTARGLLQMMEIMRNDSMHEHYISDESENFYGNDSRINKP